MKILDFDRLLTLLQMNTNENHHQENVVILTMISGSPELMVRILDVWAIMRFRGTEHDVTKSHDDRDWMTEREDIATEAERIILQKFGQDWYDKIMKCF